MKKLFTLFASLVLTFTLLSHCSVTASAYETFRVTKFVQPLHEIQGDTDNELSFHIPQTGRNCRIRVAPEDNWDNVYYDFEAIPGITYTCFLPIGISHFWITTSNLPNEELIYTFDSSIGIKPEQWAEIQETTPSYRYFRNEIHLNFTVNPDAMRFSAKESDKKDTSTSRILIWNYDLVISQYRYAVFGDVDGDKQVTTLDACQVLSHYVNSLLGNEPLISYEAFVCGDIDADNILTPNDAALILRGYTMSLLGNDIQWHTII